MLHSTPMPTYCAFLGHQPHISLAELCVLLPDIQVQKQWNQQIITFETEEELDGSWLRNVGGTVLVAQELASYPAGSRGGKEALENLIRPILLTQITKSAGGGPRNASRKAVFSFRCFSIPRSDIRALYRSCKQYLKSKGMHSRYIGSEREAAKPGTLLLRGIPGPGCSELVILHDEARKSIWIGATCAVQDITAYTQRDMGKPFRDMRTGLLPPKLAQVMLNFGLLVLPNPNPNPKTRDQSHRQNTWENITIWDPFCGSGVIAMEALLRRAHVLASDKSERAVKGCERNLTWLREREKTPRAISHHVWKRNALKPGDLPRTPALIVTETSLGPPLRDLPTKRDVAALMREAEELETAFFTAMAHACPEMPVVCIFPVYITRDGERHFLPKIFETIQKLGYRLTFPGNKHIAFTSRHTLLYLRPDQHVGREIACLLPPRKK